MVCKKNKPELTNEESAKVNGGFILMVAGDAKEQGVGVPSPEFGMYPVNNEGIMKSQGRILAKNQMHQQDLTREDYI